MTVTAGTRNLQVYKKLVQETCASRLRQNIDASSYKWLFHKIAQSIQLSSIYGVRKGTCTRKKRLQSSQFFCLGRVVELGFLHKFLDRVSRVFQACRGYGYPWIYLCVDMRLRPGCGYIHGYYAGITP